MTPADWTLAGLLALAAGLALLRAAERLAEPGVLRVRRTSPRARRADPLTPAGWAVVVGMAVALGAWIGG